MKIYLFDRERAQAEGEGEADSLLSREPHRTRSHDPEIMTCIGD